MAGRSALVVPIPGTNAIEMKAYLSDDGPMDLSLALDDAMPGAPVWLVASIEVLAAPLRGGVLVPDVDVLVPLQADASGAVHLAGALPPLPTGTTLYVQCWMPDASTPKGWSASNALSIITP